MKFRASAPRETAPGASLGLARSAGVVEGLARVVLTCKMSVYAGEIPVAPYTDPGWTPLFVHAKGPCLRGRRHDDARIGGGARMQDSCRRRRQLNHLTYPSGQHIHA